MMTMEYNKYEAEQLVKEQCKDQGCSNDTLDEIELMQPHLYQWIVFFGLKDKFIKD